MTNYSSDYETWLTQVMLPDSGGTVSFKYDPFGRRIYKQSPNATSTFVYDGDNLVQMVNSTGGTGNWRRRGNSERIAASGPRDG